MIYDIDSLTEVYKNTKYKFHLHLEFLKSSIKKTNAISVPKLCLKPNWYLHNKSYFL